MRDEEKPTSYSKEVEVEINDCEMVVTLYLECTEYSTPPSGEFGPPEFYDPGSGPDFDIDYAEITVENASNSSDTVKLTPSLFWALLGDKAQLIYDDVYESAQDSGDF